MLQPTPVPTPPFAERLRTAAGRRTLGIGLALLIEGLLLLLLLSLGTPEPPIGREEGITVIDITADMPDDASEPRSPERAEQAKEQPAPQPETDAPLPSTPVAPPPPQPAPPMPPAIIPAQRPPSTAPQPTPARPAPSRKSLYGPPDKGSSAVRDTERVGTAPNGEPLYAAAWYREPRPDELTGYLSTARGPGWGLIACRTAPDYRVEACVGLDEYPDGSQITRAVLAAAWQFKVRPPRLGGVSQVGTWVRIRIDYGIEPR